MHVLRGWGCAPSRRTVALVGGMILGWVAAGCGGGGNLTEAEVIERLEAAGLQVEPVGENLLTSAQRQRIENEPEDILSVTITDAEGHEQTMTLVSFSHDWKAEHVGDEGVPGFSVRNWYFVGVVTKAAMQTQIETALQ